MARKAAVTPVLSPSGEASLAMLAGVGPAVAAKLQARGLAIEIPHPLAGSVPQVASPIRLSETPVEYRNAPPLLGEHTEQVLMQVLGLKGDEVQRLRGAGVL